MGATTQISWTDHTWNPWLGCQRVSPGCGGAKGEGGCYAERLVTQRMKLPVWGPPSTTQRHRTAADNWKNPGRWHRAALRAGARRRVFVASLGDVFEDHPDVAPWRAEALVLLERCASLDVQLLTKRPENILRMVPPAWLAPGAWPAHVWVGCTVEDQKRAEDRIPSLLRTPAKVRFLSCEPLLEHVDLSPWLAAGPVCSECEGYGEDLTSGESCIRCVSDVGPQERISWVITGGESGPGARPFDLAWARSILAQCRDAGVPVFVKQLGDNPIMEPGPLTWPTTAHHGADPGEWPVDLRVQEFPEVSP